MTDIKADDEAESPVTVDATPSTSGAKSVERKSTGGKLKTQRPSWR
jgi:hypothetical protein